MGPKTWDNGFSKKRPKSIISNAHANEQIASKFTEPFWKIGLETTKLYGEGGLIMILFIVDLL